MARRFLVRLQQSYVRGDSIPLACVLTLEECYYVIIRGLFQRDLKSQRLRKECAKKLKKVASDVTWHDLYKCFPIRISNYVPELSRFWQFVSGFPITILEPEDLVDSTKSNPPIEQGMRGFIESGLLLPKDAMLVAEAERVGVKHIATLDRDFTRLGAGLTFTPSPS